VMLLGNRNESAVGAKCAATLLSLET